MKEILAKPEREKFEAWMASEDQAPPEYERTYELDDDGINQLTTDCMWIAWQAALAARPAAQPVIAPAERLELLARLEVAEAAYIESVRLHNLTLDQLQASKSENFQADAHKLALALEALLMSTKDDSACAKWWNMAHEALDQHRQLLDKTYPQDYVSAFGKD